MIKSRPYRIITVLMAFVVLLSSTGFGLVEHSCMMRGKSVELAALKNAATGCKMSKSIATSGVRVSSSLPAFSEKECCEDSHKYQKLEVITSTESAKKLLKVPSFFAAPNEYTGSSRRVILFLLPGAPAQPFLPFSSKFYGRGMLSFIQSFLI